MPSIPERSFEKNPDERGSGVIADRIRERQALLARTRDVRRRVLQDPAIRKRSDEALREAERPDEPKDAGVTAEELPDFLREHNS